MADTPKPMQGTWTLTAPDGRTWQADSPLRVVAMESSERVPATVRLQRILDAADEPTEREKILALLVKRLCRRLAPDDNLREGATEYLTNEGLLGSPLRADDSGVKAPPLDGNLAARLNEFRERHDISWSEDDAALVADLAAAAGVKEGGNG